MGQNIVDPDAKYSMTRHLLEGDAQAKFNEAVTTHGETSDENYTKVMDAVATHVLPVKGLAYQKRYMRRFMRKPSNMKIREFVARVNELNDYLKQFPPKSENQELQPDELKDIFEFAIPNKWHNQAIVQGKDIMSMTNDKFIKFCKRMELIESQSPEEGPKR